MRQFDSVQHFMLLSLFSPHVPHKHNQQNFGKTINFLKKQCKPQEQKNITEIKFNIIILLWEDR